MIPRKIAKRLLEEVLDRADAVSDAPDDGLRGIVDEVLEESDLVLRGAENIEQKGRRYLTEGRLTVVRLNPQTGAIVATCRGDGATYNLGYDPRKHEWRCGCPAPRRCAHLVALRLVSDLSANSENRPSPGGPSR